MSAKISFIEVERYIIIEKKNKFQKKLYIFNNNQILKSMKNVQSYVKFLLFIGVLFVFVTYTGCSDDDDEGDSKANLLIGTWTISETSLVADIGGKSIKDYFIDIGGLSELEAEAFATLFETILSSSFTGTIQFKDDNTYISNIAGDLDDGIWSLNSAGDRITLDAGTVDETVINIISLTANTLKGSLDTTELTDIDDEPLTPDVEVNLAVVMTLTK